MRTSSPSSPFRLRRPRYPALAWVFLVFCACGVFLVGMGCACPQYYLFWAALTSGVILVGRRWSTALALIVLGFALAYALRDYHSLIWGDEWRIERDSAAIDHALATYKQANGQLPSTSEGLDALVHRPPSAKSSWQQLCERVPLDYWGRPYRYRLTPERPRGYDVFSFGPTGVESGEDIHLQ